jgi:hypothetical protein
MRYFMAIPADWFRQLLSPSLGECWRTHSFRPIEKICRELSAVAAQFIQKGYDHSPVTLEVPQGLAFRPDRWRLLVGELLLFGAAELPELETPLDSYAAAMHQSLTDVRDSFPPIQQAVQGSRDVWLGGYYRPEHAGWNDEADVDRLTRWLSAVEPENWRSDDLIAIEPSDRDDELAFAKEWFPRLREIYIRAADQNQIIVCEDM